MSVYQDKSAVGRYPEIPSDDSIGFSTPLYRPIRDLDPWVSCLLRGISMGVASGFLVGLLSGFLIQYGIFEVPFFRLYGTLTGFEFYAVWTAVCICAGIPLCELFCICITPWRHIKSRKL